MNNESQNNENSPSDGHSDSESRNDLLDFGIRASFEEHASGSTGSRYTSVLKRLGDLSGAGMRDTNLPEVDEEHSPVLKPQGSQAAGPLAQIGRYQLAGEIARGGIGSVLKARDIDLGRDIALKVLLDDHQKNPEMVQRFVEEAQIGGQLQHPGIVPVHELGIDGNKRPFFTMKLIKGQTLALLLGKRKHPSEDRQRLLAIFEQTAQTVGYAHARGVIHRDLKPSNIMVGAFGEVHVMDWGLAKVIARGGAADDRRSAKAASKTSAIQTVRSRGSASDSLAGSVLGTLAYMAPEQARGDVDTLDERSDVFGLGAILCEILTGLPPYVRDDQKEVYRLAKDGNVDSAMGRLDQCGADREVIELAKRCLAIEPRHRPHSAAQVAEAIESYIGSLEERANAAKIEAAEARGNARAERLRRRVTVGVAVTVLLAVCLGAALCFHVEWGRLDQMDRTRHAVAGVMEEVIALRERADLTKEDDLSKWNEALAAVRRAEALMEGRTVDALTIERVRRLRAEIESARVDSRLRAEKKAKENAFLVLLHDTRLRSFRFLNAEDRKGQIHSDTDREFARIFREFGIDAESLETDSAVEKISEHEIPVEIAAALDEWAYHRKRVAGDGDMLWQKLIGIARRVDPSEWRDRLRANFLKTDLRSLKVLAQEAMERNLPPVTWDLLARFLISAGDNEEAITALRAGIVDHPNDFLLNFMLGILLTEAKPRSRDEALRYFQAALAISPESPMARFGLALALHRLEDYERAALHLQIALETRPDPTLRSIAQNFLGVVYLAQQETEKAISAFHEAIQTDPTVAAWHTNMAIALAQNGDNDGADRAINRALQLRPDLAEPYSGLGQILKNKGKPKEAIEAFKAAVSRRPDIPDAYYFMGSAFFDAGDMDGTIDACKKAIRVDPNSFKAHLLFGRALKEEGNLDGAIAAYHQAIHIDPRKARAHSLLGGALEDKGEICAAVEAHQEAIRLKPSEAAYHYNLGCTHSRAEDIEKAKAAYEEAVQLDPSLAEAHANLGISLRVRSDFEGAIRHSKRAIELKPTLVPAHDNLAKAYARTGQIKEALEACGEGLRWAPGDADLLCTLAACQALNKEWDKALGTFQKATEMEPDDAEAHYGLAKLLLAKKSLDQAVASLRQVVRLKPDSMEARHSLLEALFESGDLDGTIRECWKALGVAPEDAAAHALLGVALQRKGKTADAKAALAKAIQLDPRIVQAHVGMALVLHDEGNQDGAVASANKALELDQGNADAYNILGMFSIENGNVDKAVSLFETAIQLDRKFVEARRNLGLAFRRKGELDKAIRQLREVIDIDPGYRIAHINLVEILLENHDEEGALLALREMERRFPEEGRVYSRLGVILAKRGQVDNAIKAFDRALELNPLDLRAHRELGRLLLRKGQPEMAVVVFKEAVRLSPTNPATHCDLGIAVGRLGDMDGAVVSFREALHLKEDYAEAQKHLGLALSRRGDLDAATTVWQKLIDAHPEMIEIYMPLSAALHKKGDLEGALRVAREATRLQPKQARPHCALGSVLLEKGDRKGAVAAFTKAIQLNPADAEAYHALGGALMWIGRFREAIPHLRRAQELSSRYPSWSYPTARWLRECEVMSKLEPKIEAIQKGGSLPTNGTQCANLARICFDKQIWLTSVRLYEAAFEADASLAEDLTAKNRYHAACAAVLAAAGSGVQGEPLSQAESAEWRSRGLSWLQSELGFYATLCTAAWPETKSKVRLILEGWQKEPNLELVRMEDCLARLPADEQAVWKALWAKVAQLIRTTYPPAERGEA